MNNEKKVLALFDFDGTITRKDSFLEFVKYAVGRPKFLMGCILLSPLLILYLLKLLSGHHMKEFFLTFFFKNWPESRFAKTAGEYSRQMDAIIKPSAMERISWHQKQNHDIYIVSASIDYWLNDWCRSHQLKLISTHIQITDNKVTGKLLNKNCYGPEKTRRIRETIPLSEYHYIYAYGDSSGDREMLEMSNEPYFRYFND